MTAIDADPYLRDYASPTVDRQSASVVTIESSKMLPLIIILAIMSGVSISLAIFAIILANTAEREGRMAQYRADGMQKQMIANGFPDPGDDYSWHSEKKPKQVK